MSSIKVIGKKITKDGALVARVTGYKGNYGISTMPEIKFYLIVDLVKWAKANPEKFTYLVTSI